MNEDLIAKAKEARSVTELMKIAEANDYPLNLDSAEEIFDMLHRSGELDDDELDAVSGGGCQIDVDGNNYTVVTAGLECFNGQFSSFRSCDVPRRFDNLPLRHHWELLGACFGPRTCGKCFYLEFKGQVAYCGLSREEK